MNPKRLTTKRTLVVGAVVVAVSRRSRCRHRGHPKDVRPQGGAGGLPGGRRREARRDDAELENAYKAAALERLDAAVAAGRLTEEQADAIRERIESGDFLGQPPSASVRRARLRGRRPLHLERAADYLGLTEAELHEQLRDGQSLAEIAKAEGKSVDGLKQALLAAAKEQARQRCRRRPDHRRPARRDAREARVEGSTTS